MDEIARFLSMHPPWRSLPADQVRGVAGVLEIEYFARGARLLSAGGRPPSRLAIIRSGSVEVVRHGRKGSELVDRLEEGDVVGAELFLMHRSPDVDAVAREDSLVYLVRREHLDPLLEFPAVRTFLLGTSGQRVRDFVSNAATSDNRGFMSSPIGDLVTRPPLACAPDTPVDEVAGRMRDGGVGSMLVQSEPPGIVTDRDLRDRVLAVKGDPLGPVGAIASRLLGQVPHDANVFDVMALLVESGLRHLPVTREGRIVGVVTDTDILRRQSGSPLLLHSVLQRAHDPGGIASWVRLAAAAIVGMNDDGIGAVNVGRMSSLAADLLLRRLVADATARLGAAPAAWAWLATGAEGRREAFWPSSRAGFVLFEEGASAGMVRWCADLAAQVSAGLLAAGLRPAIAAPCPADSGGMGPASAVLIDAIVRDHFLLLPALLDARPVAGSMNPGPFLKELRDAARAAVLTGRQVLKGLHRPPKGFFHDEVLEAGGTIADRLDLDARCLRLLVVLARVVAVRGGIAATSTPERLVASADAGVLSRELAMDLAASWEFVAGLCLRTGWAAKAQGECLLVPDSLSPTDRRLLKDVFSVIGEGLSSIFGDLSAAEDPWTN